MPDRMKETLSVKSAKEIWVFGAVERHSCPLNRFIEVVARRSSTTLTEGSIAVMVEFAVLYPPMSD